MPPTCELAVLHCENVGDLYIHLQDVSIWVAQGPDLIIISKNLHNYITYSAASQQGGNN